MENTRNLVAKVACAAKEYSPGRISSSPLLGFGSPSILRRPLRAVSQPSSTNFLNLNLAFKKSRSAPSSRDSQQSDASARRLWSDKITLRIRSVVAILAMVLLVSHFANRSSQPLHRPVSRTVYKPVVLQEPLSGSVDEASVADFEERISFTVPHSISSISIAGDRIRHWTEGGFEVLHILGDVRVKQASFAASAGEAILWVEIPEDKNDPTATHRVHVYLENNVDVSLSTQDNNQPVDRIKDRAWFGRLKTAGTVDLSRATSPLTGAPPAIIENARLARSQNSNGSIQQASFFAIPIDQNGNSRRNDGLVWVEDNRAENSVFAQRPQTVVNPQTGQLQTIVPDVQAPATPDFQPGSPYSSPGQPNVNRSPFRIDVVPRDPTIGMNFKNFINPANPNERVSIATGGVRLSIDSAAIADAEIFQGDGDRKLYVLADNVVAWQLTLPDGSQRNQLYLEGDVVFSKGSRVINARQMYYDVETQQGTILKADMRTTASGVNGPVRIKADVIQQLDENRLNAFGAAMTTSRLGVPRYWLQSESIGLQQVAPAQPGLVFDPANGVASSRLTDGLGGLADLEEPESQYVVDGQRNRIYFGGVPVFAWPRIRTSLNDPTLYLESFNINNDRIFGTQIRTGWNLHQLLGLQRPEGTRWIGKLDYLSERGLGFGTESEYQRDGFLGVPGQVAGRYESWFINDRGTDFLGRDRVALTPEEEFRGRSVLNHRHNFGPGYQLRAEFGYISDRNFLEQFYEREWDTYKDATTGFWLERNVGTRSFNLTGDLQVNRFFTQTSGLKFDQFTLGQPILNNRAIWHAHHHAGYQRIRQASTPTDPVDAAKFDPLAWEANVDGFTAGTRQEIDFPMQIGPVKLVPYLLGDISYWQEALDGNDLLRTYGQTGVRASLPMWRVDPSIKSVLWNVDGLAHKISLDVDAFFAEASQDLDELALYDPLDDDAQEHFRRRFAFDTFGIVPGLNVPLRFDERNFAFRSGVQGNVTGPREIADDLMAVKLGARQKWQTKRGLPGRQRIVDWITFDTQAILYPKANRDNFGSDFGNLDYDFRWYVGDRLSLVSDGYFDFFSQGLRTASFGANISRPEVGNVYVGFRTIEGPISSNILSAALTYRMSDQWGVEAGGQIDFGETGTIGQSLSLVHIGESFLWQFGFNFDHSRNNLGVRFGFEPRFTKRPRLFRPGGVPVGPAGAKWLE